MYQHRKGTHIRDEQQRRAIFETGRQTSTGAPIGIIAIELQYPKIPGNVVCASSFEYPVIYETVSFEIERLFSGDKTLEAIVIQAAQTLEERGARAVVGACGFFAHFQDSVARSINIPVFLSSLIQIPMILTGISPEKKLCVLCADKEGLSDELLAQIHTTSKRLIIASVGDHQAFAPIRFGIEPLDNGALIDDLTSYAAKLTQAYPEIGAFLLECSDLPPYAADIHDACGLPVFDFMTLIDWVHTAVIQRRYYGAI